MPFQAWIPSSCRLALWTVKGLQWGHALSGMDTDDSIPKRTTYYDASMGPCPFRHGYVQEKIRKVTFLSGFNGAMPFQAWIRKVNARLPAPTTGFNGAMPFQAWIHCLALRCSNTSARFNGAMPFQAWIHVGPRARRVCKVWLQWGHALSGMDTFRSVQQYSHHPPASMGPCPFRHGYSAAAPPAAIGRMGFNGAMPFQAWIPETFRIAANNLAAASMGPCPFRHGYLVGW